MSSPLKRTSRTQIPVIERRPVEGIFGAIGPKMLWRLVLQPSSYHFGLGEYSHPISLFDNPLRVTSRWAYGPRGSLAYVRILQPTATAEIHTKFGWSD